MPFLPFVYGYPSSSPHAHCTPNKSVPTLRYTHRHGPISIEVHARRLLPSAVPWISEDRLLASHITSSFIAYYYYLSCLWRAHWFCSNSLDLIYKKKSGKPFTCINEYCQCKTWKVSTPFTTWHLVLLGHSVVLSKHHSLQSMHLVLSKHHSLQSMHHMSFSPAWT